MLSTMLAISLGFPDCAESAFAEAAGDFAASETGRIGDVGSLANPRSCFISSSSAAGSSGGRPSVEWPSRAPSSRFAVSDSDAFLALTRDSRISRQLAHAAAVAAEISASR